MSYKRSKPGSTPQDVRRPDKRSHSGSSSRRSGGGAIGGAIGGATGAAAAAAAAKGGAATTAARAGSSSTSSRRSAAASSSSSSARSRTKGRDVALEGVQGVATNGRVWSAEERRAMYNVSRHLNTKPRCTTYHTYFDVRAPPSFTRLLWSLGKASGT